MKDGIMKQEIYQYVEKYVKIKKWAEHIQKKLSDILSKDVPIELIKEVMLEIRNARDGIKEVDEIIVEVKTKHKEKEKEKKDWWLKDIVKGMWEGRPYDYIPETDHIVFYPDGQPYPVLRTTVLAIHEKYVRDGENLSGRQMMSEFQLTPKAKYWFLADSRNSSFYLCILNQPYLKTPSDGNNGEEFASENWNFLAAADIGMTIVWADWIKCSTWLWV